MPEKFIQRFLKAVAEERMSFKEVARAAGVSSETIERLRSGETKKLDLGMVHAVSKKARNPRAFWATVLGDAVSLPEQNLQNHAQPVEDRLQKLIQILGNRIVDETSNLPLEIPTAHWITDDGSRIPIKTTLEASAYEALGVKGDLGDGVDFICRGFGWIAVQPIFDGENTHLSIRYDHANISPVAASKLSSDLATYVRTDVRIRLGKEWDLTCDVLEARRRIDRRVRAGARMPVDWVNRQIPVDEIAKDLDTESLNRFIGDPSIGLFDVLDMGNVSLFAVDENEATCLHIGSSFKVPSRNDIGKRVLDRQSHTQFAALVDRNVVTAAQTGQVSAAEVGVDFISHRALYRRLTVPFKRDNRHFVLTASRVLNEAA